MSEPEKLFSVVLDANRSVFVPLEFSRADWQYLNSYLSLYIAYTEKKKEKAKKGP